MMILICECSHEESQVVEAKLHFPQTYVAWRLSREHDLKQNC